MTVLRNDFLQWVQNRYGSVARNKCNSILPQGSSIDDSVALGTLGQAHVSFQDPTPSPCVVRLRSRNVEDSFDEEAFLRDE